MGKPKKNIFNDPSSAAALIHSAQSAAGSSLLASYWNSADSPLAKAAMGWQNGAGGQSIVSAATGVGGPAARMAESFAIPWSQKVNGDLQTAAMGLVSQYGMASKVGFTESVAAGIVSKSMLSSYQTAVNDLHGKSPLVTAFSAVRAGALTSLAEASGLSMASIITGRKGATSLVEAYEQLGWTTNKFFDDSGVSALLDFEVDDEQLAVIEDDIGANPERVDTIRQIESRFERYYGLSRDQSHRLVRLIVFLTTIGGVMSLLYVDTQLCAATSIAGMTKYGQNAIDNLAQAVADKVTPLPDEGAAAAAEG